MIEIGLKKYENFYFSFKHPSEEHFRVGSIWCEFWTAPELDDMNIATEWMDENIFGHVDGTNIDVYYSTTEMIDYATREFVLVRCDFKIGTNDLKGVLHITSGSVRSFRLFYKGFEIYYFQFDDDHEFGEDDVEIANAVASIKGLVGQDTCIGYSIPNDTRKHLRHIRHEGTFELG